MTKVNKINSENFTESLASLLSNQSAQKESPLKLGFKRLNDEATLPVRAHKTDSGYDLFASEDVIIDPSETKLVPTGIAVQLPEGCEAVVRPKSGITSKTKLRVQLGTIDIGFTGEVKVIVDNTHTGNTGGVVKRYAFDVSGKKIIEKERRTYGSYIIRKGDKIAQLVVQYLPQVEAVEIAGELTDSDRGEGGFGSTGIRAKEESE